MHAIKGYSLIGYHRFLYPLRNPLLPISLSNQYTFAPFHSILLSFLETRAIRKILLFARRKQEKDKAVEDRKDGILAIEQAKKQADTYIYIYIYTVEDEEARRKSIAATRDDALHQEATKGGFGVWIRGFVEPSLRRERERGGGSIYPHAADSLKGERGPAKLSSRGGFSSSPRRI